MSTIREIPSGRAGLDLKARKIRALVEQAKRDPWVRERAAQVVAHVEQKDTRGEIAAVFDFVRDRVRYLRDPYSAQGLELFTTPRRMLEDIDRGTASGDCDDHVILASALLESIGYRTRYRIGGMPPDRYRHIWLEVDDPKTGWIPLELTAKGEGLGFDPSSRFPLRLTLTGERMYQPSGIGGWTPSRSRVRHPRRIREVGSRRQLGEDAPPSLDEPQSWWNRQTANGQAPDWWGAAPSDMMRAMSIREMAPVNVFGHGLLDDYDTDELGKGLFKKLGKKLKKATKSLTKLATAPIKIATKLGKGTIKAVTGFSKGSKRSTPGVPETEIVSEQPVTGTPAEVTPGGYAEPLPAYQPGATAAVVSASAPYYQDPVPSGDGSYIPTPDDWPPQDGSEAFESQSYGGGELAPNYGTGSAGNVFTASTADDWDNDDQTPLVDDGSDDMDNTFGSLGAESWISDLAKQAATTALQYQQARLASKAATKGYGALSFGPPQGPQPKPREEKTGGIMGSMGLILPVALIGGAVLILSRRRK